MVFPPTASAVRVFGICPLTIVAFGLLYVVRYSPRPGLRADPVVAPFRSVAEGFGGPLGDRADADAAKAVAALHDLDPPVSGDAGAVWLHPENSR